MNRFVTVALLLVAVLLVLPAAGSAATRTQSAPKTSHARTHRSASRARRQVLAPVDSRDPVTTAVAIADGYWGAVPCGGQVKVVTNSALLAGMGSATDGWVTFNSSLGSDNLDAPAATYTHCTISLARWAWSSWTAMESDWGMFCLTVVHETGHLLGHKHSLVRGSVMAPVFTSDANVPAVCNATWLAGWRAASASARAGA